MQVHVQVSRAAETTRRRGPGQGGRTGSASGRGFHGRIGDDVLVRLSVGVLSAALVLVAGLWMWMVPLLPIALLVVSMITSPPASSAATSGADVQILLRRVLRLAPVADLFDVVVRRVVHVHVVRIQQPRPARPRGATCAPRVLRVFADVSTKPPLPPSGPPRFMIAPCTSALSLAHTKMRPPWPAPSRQRRRCCWRPAYLVGEQRHPASLLRAVRATICPECLSVAANIPTASPSRCPRLRATPRGLTSKRMPSARAP